MDEARVLDVAENLLGERGFFRVTLDEIAAEAGADPSELAAAYPDTAALLIRVAQDRAHELRSHLHHAVDGLTSRAMMEGEGFRAWFEWISRHPHINRIIRQCDLVDREVFRDWYRDLASDYVRGLTRAMDEGEIQTLDAETLTWCLMGMGDFVGMRFILWDERPGLPSQVSRTFQRLVTKMLT